MTVTVEEGKPLRVNVSQPEDLLFSISFGSEPSHEIDSFDFGIEAATLVAAGEYRVDIVAVSGIRKLAFDIWSTFPSLHEATVFARAEEHATQLKTSHSIAECEKSLAMWKATGDSLAVARAQLRLGGSYLALGNAFQAREQYEAAYEICRRASDSRCLAEAANNSGLAAEQIGEFEQASERLEEAVSEWKKESNPVFAGRTLSNLGLANRRMGNYEKAIVYYDQARTLLKSTDQVSYARVLNNLGICYTTLGEYPRAIVYLQSALEMYRMHPSPRDSVRSRLNLGRTIMLSGAVEAAEKTLRQALSESGEDQSARADVLVNLGQLAYRRKQLSKGRDLFEQALAIQREIKDRRGEASSLHYLGMIAAALGDRDAAQRSLQSASAIRIDLRLRDDSADSLYELARLAYEDGDISRAKHLAEQSLSLLESARMQVSTPALRASFYSNKRRLFELLLEIAMAGSNPDSVAEGLLVVERGRSRALMDVLAEKTNMDQVPRSLLVHRLVLQRRIDLLTARLTPDSSTQESVRGELELLVAEDAEAETRLRDIVAADEFSVPLTDLKPLQQRLPKGTALVEFYLSEHRSYVWVVDRACVRVFVLPSYPRLQSSIRQMLHLFGDVSARQRSVEKQKEFDRSIRRLSSLLLGPLDRVALPPKVILVPDRSLNAVPLAALTIPGEAERLGLKHDLLQIPAAAYLVAGREPEPPSTFPKRLLAVTDPVFSRDDPRVRVASNTQQLAGTAVETSPLARLPFASDMRTLYPVVPPALRTHLHGFDASTAILASHRLRDYAVLYLSTHAIVDDRTPELSRIMLSQVDVSGKAIDGFLRPYHFSRFQISGSVMVLSACRTAMGKEVLGEGLAGFTSSLFSAGAAQLVLSLDEVDAEATAHFFNEAFRQYFTAGTLGMEHAMTLARRQMAASLRWSDPYYWASFVVFGRPTPAVHSR